MPAKADETDWHRQGRDVAASSSFTASHDASRKDAMLKGAVGRRDNRLDVNGDKDKNGKDALTGI